MTELLKLPDMPYPMKALEPHISERSLAFHHGKHHAAYVRKTNEAIKGTALEKKTLEEIIQQSFKEKNAAVFNNAAQVWNHTFFWNSMAPSGGNEPAGDLARRIVADFDSFEGFCEKFAEAALSRFGSGWAWLVEDRGKLAVMTTPNAENPLVHGKKPLLTIDVWEHAYYPDYQDRRPDFVKAFLEHLANWKFVEQNLQ
jgi:Fe-Mn family superoxide dismutase